MTRHTVGPSGPREHAPDRIGRLFQRRQRILDCRDSQARHLEATDHVGPARAVREEAVHEYDVCGREPPCSSSSALAGSERAPAARDRAGQYRSKRFIIAHSEVLLPSFEAA